MSLSVQLEGVGFEPTGPPKQLCLTDTRTNYCDVAIMAKGKISDEALAAKDLQTQVVKHEETSCPSGWARYDLARPGSVRLVPPDSRVAALEQNYKRMGVMIFGEQPAFGWVLDRLGTLEKRINK